MYAETISSIIIIEVFTTFIVLNVVFPKDKGYALKDFYTIRGLYDITNMNMFGCIISCILIYLLSLWASIPYLIYLVMRAVCNFAYWITHVGRK